MINFDTRFSKRILVRLAAATVLLVGGGIAGLDLIADIYLREQLTPTGLIINGSILLLFTLGMVRILLILRRYAREEAAVAQFLRDLEEDDYEPGGSVDPDSIIFRRYLAILGLSKRNAPINHGAMASTLVATEGTRLSFPKFVNNILILTGVFGTIVSLSIALLGASNLLGAGQDLGDMGLVIHGMSTALSTTITAIVCYLFYGYFYLKLTDAQTHLFSGIEQVTTLYLLPRYSHTPDSMMHGVAGLVRSLQEVAETMQAQQTAYTHAGVQLREILATLQQRVGPLGDDMQRIKALLREGFRLSEADD